MRRLSRLEKLLALLGAILVLGGTGALLRPTSMTVLHPNSYFVGPQGPRVLSKGQVRFYGSFTLLIGAGLVFYGLYRARE